MTTPARTFAITGKLEEIDGKMTLSCNEFPLAGIGENDEEAIASFADCLERYFSSANASHKNIAQRCIVE